MRVGAVVITPPAYKASGGVSAAIQLTQRVAHKEDTQLFLMDQTDDVATEGGLRITRQRPKNALLRFEKLLPRGVVSLAWRPSLKHWLREGKFDIVHFHNPHPPGALESAARDCTELGIPYVISTHGFVEFNSFSRGFGAPAWQKPLLDFLVRGPIVRVARGAARVLMLSPQEEAIMLDMGVQQRNLRVVSNGVDAYFAEPISPTIREKLTERFNLPSNRPLMLYVGNHTTNKGIDVLLRALPLMREEATAIIAGAIRSPREHAKLLADNGVTEPSERLLFTDFITKEELRALYQTADLFVFPTRADTLPLVVLEGMASGLPIVSTQVGGIPFQVTPETGILVEPGAPAPLAEALDKLCSNPQLRTSMGMAAKSRVLDVFNWEQSATRAVEIYGEVVGDRRRSSSD